MRTLLALAVFALLSTGAIAQQAVATTESSVPNASPDGDWRDEFGTTLRLSLCGDGTQLCAVLLDVQGESRTADNLAYLNRQIMQAEMTAPDTWQGQVMFGGSQADSKITQVAPDTIEIQGCRAAILCQTLAFSRL